MMTVRPAVVVNPTIAITVAIVIVGIGTTKVE